MSILDEGFRRKLVWAAVAVALGALAYTAKGLFHTGSARDEGERRRPAAAEPGPAPAMAVEPRPVPARAAAAPAAPRDRLAVPPLGARKKPPRASGAVASSAAAPAREKAVAIAPGGVPAAATPATPASKSSTPSTASTASTPTPPSTATPASTESVSVLEQDCGTATLDPKTGEITYTRPPSPDGVNVCTLRVTRPGNSERDDPDRE